MANQNDGLVEITHGKRTARVLPESVATWEAAGWKVAKASETKSDSPKTNTTTK